MLNRRKIWGVSWPGKKKFLYLLYSVVKCIILLKDTTGKKKKKNLPSIKGCTWPSVGVIHDNICSTWRKGPNVSPTIILPLLVVFSQYILMPSFFQNNNAHMLYHTTYSGESKIHQIRGASINTRSSSNTKDTFSNVHWLIYLLWQVWS